METTWRARPVLTARLAFALLITLLVHAPWRASALIVGIAAHRMRRRRLSRTASSRRRFRRAGPPCSRTRASTDGQLDIYTIRADGTDRRRITTDPNDEVDPVFSPDGIGHRVLRAGAAADLDSGRSGSSTRRAPGPASR